MKKPTWKKPLCIDRRGNDLIIYYGDNGEMGDSYMDGQEAAAAIKWRCKHAWDWLVGFVHYAIGRRM